MSMAMRAPYRGCWVWKRYGSGRGGRGGAPFGGEGPIVEAGGIGEEDLKGVAEITFVFDILGSNFGY